MNKIKNIFVDFDWTLYDHNLHKLNDSGIKALQKAKQSGLRIILNSARSYYSLKGMDNILELINFDGCSCVNGLINIANNKVINATYLDENIVKEIIKICEDNQLDYLLVSDFTSYLKIFNNQRIEDFYSIFHEPRGTDINLCHSLKNIYGIQLFITEDYEYLFKELKDKVVFHRFCSIATEVQTKLKNKGDAIDEFIKFYKLSPENSIAIGDSEDDIAMFKKVKYGICMGNGTEKAKENAFYVTDTIENNGLEKALKKFNII